MLNDLYDFDPYPTPMVDDLVERFGNANFLVPTTLNLCKAYWQVPLAEVLKDLTTFRVPSGLYWFRMMPFGLHGAPAIFQRLGDKILRGAEDCAAAYIDDIVNFSRTWEQPVQHQANIFQWIQSAGLVINTKICHIAKPDVQYLGYLIGGGGICPQVGKMEAIAAAPLPTTKQGLKSFFGLVSYCRFMPDFSTRAAILNDNGSIIVAHIIWCTSIKASNDGAL